MKKSLRIILSCLIIVAFVAIIAFNLWKGGAFLPRSADVDSNHITWNGQNYSPVLGGDYTEDRTIAKGKDADWVVISIKEDPSHTFVVARSFLDQYLMVSDDYSIPSSGELTTVSWNGKYISNSAFLTAVSSIEAEKTTSFTYETDGIYKLTEHQRMRSLCFAYEGCPVATHFKGYMGKVNGEWVITTSISECTKSADGSQKSYSVSCYRIPEEYWEILSEYFS